MEIFVTVLKLSGTFFDRLEVDFSSDCRDSARQCSRIVGESSNDFDQTLIYLQLVGD